jgi:hypothetical protein
MPWLEHLSAGELLQALVGLLAIAGVLWPGRRGGNVNPPPTHKRPAPPPAPPAARRD